MKETGFFEQMKTKKFCIVLIFVVVSSGTIWLLGSPPPAFDNVVIKTHKGARNLPTNIQANHEATVSPVYLSRLGLKETQPDGKITSSDDKVLAVQPVICTSVDRENWESVIAFIQSVSWHMPDYHLVIFDLTSSEVTHVSLQNYCNSTWNCEVRRFEFEKYPSHVADLSIKSYRPICIQEMLNNYGAVIWVDCTGYFTSSNISRTLEQAKAVGLVAWTIEHPTSTITHPNMFRFFQTKQDLYYFHRAVESSQLIVFNLPLVREKIMLPWVRCALLEDCINPTGAQNTGCNFMRKPLFKYSGCHFYDMSALNVILGAVFDFDEHAYAARENIFSSFTDGHMPAENSSEPFHGPRLKVRGYLNGWTR